MGSTVVHCANSCLFSLLPLFDSFIANMVSMTFGEHVIHCVSMCFLLSLPTCL